MENFDLKKFLVENKLTSNSKLLKEDYGEETVEQAFKKANIDLTKAITAIPSERVIILPGLKIKGDHPVTMLGRDFANLLEQERLRREKKDPYYDKYDEVLYDYEDDIRPGTGELMGEEEEFEEYTKGLTCKLQVYFGDFMFEIWQKDTNLKADPNTFSVNENLDFNYQDSETGPIITMNNGTKDAILDNPQLQDFITPRHFIMNNKGEVVLRVDWMDYDQFDKLANFLGIEY